MASAVPVRPFHLAVVGLGLACLLLLAGAATGNGTDTELLPASVLPRRLDRFSDDTCPVRDLEYATCTFYRYLPANGTVDRARPFAGLRMACHAAGSDDFCQGQVGDLIQRHCLVRAALLVSEGPEGEDWCVLHGHQPPIAGDVLATAGGDDVCYVELEHGNNNHREGYYVLCPVREYPRYPILCCPAFPDDGALGSVDDEFPAVY